MKTEKDTISVVGMAFRLPRCQTFHDLNALLFSKARTADLFPLKDRTYWTRWHQKYSRSWEELEAKFCLLDNVDSFDTDFFGMGPGEAAHTDPQHLLSLQLTWEALEEANLDPTTLEGKEVGTYVGICQSDFHLMNHRNLKTIGEYHAVGTTRSAAATRISYYFDFRGPAVAMDTACSSSTVALHYACRDLQSGAIDYAVVGGVNLILSPEGTISLRRKGLLSPTHQTRSFDAEANGYVRGEGAVFCILMRSQDVLSKRLCSKIELVSTAVAQDGRSNGFLAPNPDSLERVMRSALESAGIEPSDLQFIEGQGTGNNISDGLELEAIGKIFEKHSKTGVLLGSVKPNIGHLEAASGLASLVKAYVVLKSGQHPPQLDFSVANKMGSAPFQFIEIPKETKTLSQSKSKQYGLINCFGAGGTNTATVVSIATAHARQNFFSRSKRQYLFLSAKTKKSIAQLARVYLTWLSRKTTDEEWNEIAYVSRVGRAQLPFRIALEFFSAKDLYHPLKNIVEESSPKLEPQYTPRHKIYFVLRDNSEPVSKNSDRSRIEKWKLRGLHGNIFPINQAADIIKDEKSEIASDTNSDILGLDRLEALSSVESGDIVIDFSEAPDPKIEKLIHKQGASYFACENPDDEQGAALPVLAQYFSIGGRVRWQNTDLTSIKHNPPYYQWDTTCLFNGERNESEFD